MAENVVTFCGVSVVVMLSVAFVFVVVLGCITVLKTARKEWKRG